MIASDTVAEIVASFGGGLLAGWLLVSATRGVFTRPAFERRNWRDSKLPTAVGVLIVPAVAVVAATARLLAAAGMGVSGAAFSALLTSALAVAGFALLGLIDDVGGIGESGGFRGHLEALTHGQVTTGLLKLVGGAALALLVVPGEGGLLGLLRDAAIVALAANLANLLDRAPGRVLKAAVAAFAVLLAFASSREWAAGGAAVIGAALALLPGDLAERSMLGDAGSNALGAGLGLTVVLTVGSSARWGVLAALLALNVASEVVSFSRVIEAFAPLRFLDRLGRRP